MKRLLTATLAVLLLFTGCSGDEESSEGAEANWPFATESSDHTNVSSAGSNSASPSGSAAASENPDALPVCLELADAYMQMYENGLKFADMGLKYQADYEYGRALAAISAMRQCADELLIIQGEDAPEDGRLSNWEEIGALNFAEWGVWIFEGIALHAQGDTAAAETCFDYATMNQEYEENAEDALLVIYYLNPDELKTLRRTLTEYEDKIRAEFIPEAITYPRDEYAFSGAYLMSQAMEALKTDDYAVAMECLQAAMRVDPDNGDAYAVAATTSLYMDDLDRTAYYINEGLFIAPDHAGLNTLRDAYNEGGGGQ